MNGHVNKWNAQSVCCLHYLKLFHTVHSREKISILEVHIQPGMKYTTLLQFNDLSELGCFIKTVHPDTYLVNTMKLTLLATLSDFEIAVAIEQFRGELVPQKVEV